MSESSQVTNDLLEIVTSHVRGCALLRKIGTPGRTQIPVSRVETSIEVDLGDEEFFREEIKIKDMNKTQLETLLKQRKGASMPFPMPKRLSKVRQPQFQNQSSTMAKPQKSSTPKKKSVHRNKSQESLGKLLTSRAISSSSDSQLNYGDFVTPSPIEQTNQNSTIFKTPISQWSFSSTGFQTPLTCHLFPSVEDGNVSPGFYTPQEKFIGWKPFDFLQVPQSKSTLLKMPPFPPQITENVDEMQTPPSRLTKPNLRPNLSKKNLVDEINELIKLQQKTMNRMNLPMEDTKQVNIDIHVDSNKLNKDSPCAPKRIFVDGHIIYNKYE